MKHVHILHILEYPNLDEFAIYCAELARKVPQMSMMTIHVCFLGLQFVQDAKIFGEECPALKKLPLKRGLKHSTTLGRQW
ncbi:hypothetical protein ACFX2I_025030 [Malus domestica]